MDNPFNHLEHHFHLPEVSEVPVLSPFGWVADAWKDVRRSPLASLSYGLIIVALLGLVLSFGLDRPYLFTASISGFFLIAPVLLVGLFEISRRHGAGQDATFADSLTGWRRNAQSIGLFSLLLVIVTIAWERLSAVMFALLYGGSAPDLERFVHEIFLSGDYPRLVTVYVLSGLALSALVFALSAVALPMIVDRNTDVATATMASFKAVAMNPVPMAVWAATIVGLTAIGFATFLVAMVFIMPVLGHATWHAYKALIK